MAASVETVDIILPLEESENEESRRMEAAKKLGLPRSRVTDTKLRKHSIDARQRAVKVQLRLDVALDGPFEAEEPPTWSCPPLSANAKTAIIVGCGPAGLFAALRCLETGVKPIVLE
ncbi:MAG: FAD-binding protein, partial [Verrucomicrobiaceae bacterium]